MCQGDNVLDRRVRRGCTDFFDVVNSQRAIRSFRQDAIPDELIWKIIDAAVRAPSGSNHQPWIWLVVKDEGKRRMIAERVRERFGDGGRLEQMRRNAESIEDPACRRMMLSVAEFFSIIAVAPVLIIPCLVRVTSPVNDPKSLYAGSSVYGAVQNLMLAARSLGIGTVLTTFNMYMEGALRKEFDLPDDAVPACIIPLGYPDKQRFGPTACKPAEAVTYWDSWGQARRRNSKSGLPGTCRSWILVLPATTWPGVRPSTAVAHTMEPIWLSRRQSGDECCSLHPTTTAVKASNNHSSRNAYILYDPVKGRSSRSEAGAASGRRHCGTGPPPGVPGSAPRRDRSRIRSPAPRYRPNTPWGPSWEPCPRAI